MIFDLIPQVSEPGNSDTLELLQSYFSHESIDIQGMAVWAIGQITHDASGKLVIATDLRAQLLQALFQMEVSSDTLSHNSLVKVINWVITRISMTDVKRQNDFQAAPRIADELPTHCPASQKGAAAEESQVQNARTPRKSVPNYVIKNMESISEMMLQLDTDLEKFNFLLFCLQHRRPDIREAAFENLVAIFDPRNVDSYEILTTSILKQRDEVTSSALLLILGKSAMPGDSSVSSFVTRYLMNKIRNLMRVETYLSTRQDLGKEYNTVAIALQVLTDLEASGSRMLFHAAVACSEMRSEVICKVLQEALNKAVIPGCLDDTQLTVILRIIDSKNPVLAKSKCAQMLINRLRESGNQKVILSLEALSQRTQQLYSLQDINASKSEKPPNQSATCLNALLAEDNGKVGLESSHQVKAILVIITFVLTLLTVDI